MKVSLSLIWNPLKNDSNIDKERRESTTICFTSIRQSNECVGGIEWTELMCCSMRLRSLEKRSLLSWHFFLFVLARVRSRNLFFSRARDCRSRNSASRLKVPAILKSWSRAISNPVSSSLVIWFRIACGSLPTSRLVFRRHWKRSQKGGGAILTSPETQTESERKNQEKQGVKQKSVDYGVGSLWKVVGWKGSDKNSLTMRNILEIVWKILMLMQELEASGETSQDRRDLEANSGKQI